eukprot:1138674-Pelagomonas_calceolata.AAC.1
MQCPRSEPWEAHWRKAGQNTFGKDVRFPQTIKKRKKEKATRKCCYYKFTNPDSSRCGKQGQLITLYFTTAKSTRSGLLLECDQIHGPGIR